MDDNIWSNTKLKDFGKESVLDFIQTKIKHGNNFKEDILDKITYVSDKITYVSDEVTDETIIEDRSSQGFYYERLWDLCIKFGVTDLTLPSIKGHLQTSHIINENPNKSDIQFQKNCWAGNKLNINPGGYLLQPVRSGNSGGYSDITFLNKYIDDKDNSEKEELYFISVKYFKEEKEISKYDIGKLCTLIEAHAKENRTINLYIFVKNKENAIKKFNSQHSSSAILIKYINPGGKYEHIYDTHNLQNFYFKLKKLLEQYNYLQTPENIENFQRTYLNVLKNIFIPRFHQELFILKINKLIENGEKNILVGAIPRSGKSYIMAGTILEYVLHNEAKFPGKKYKFLMMTPAPNETFVEYENIFNNYIEFEQLGIDVITHKGNLNSKQVCGTKHRHCVIIISKQKLGWSAGSKAEEMLELYDDIVLDNADIVSDNEDIVLDEEGVETDKDIKNIEQRITKLIGTNPDINVMFLDEAHFGMSTEKAQKIVNVLNSIVENTVKIYVTATYNKPLQAYGVKPDCKLTWDMNDIKIMQNISDSTITDNPIKQQFGSDIYTKALEYYGDKSGISLIAKFKKEYGIYPKPYLITSLWDKEFLNVEKLKIGDTEFGWDMNKLFATTGDSANFANEEQMKEIMRYYFGYPNKDENYDKQSFYRLRGIIPRIRNICLNNCRTLQQNHKTTQLWFLPLGNGKIKHKMKALINVLTHSNEFKDVKKNYHFFVAVDIEDKTTKGQTINGVTYMGNPREIKMEIEKVEKYIKDGKINTDNLIILAGQRLQLGISLRNVDIVTLWNSISSTDAIFQMLFRSMTEVETPPCIQDEYCDQKKFGFMVDMNPQRALTNVNLFSENMTKKPDDDDDIQKYRQITDLINIDEDVLHDKYGDSEAQKDKFVADLFNKLYASWNINVGNIKKLISKFSFDTQKLESLKEVFQKINISKQERKHAVIELDEEETIQTGKKKERVLPKKEREKKEKQEKEINLNEFAGELLAEFISLLNIFTLYADVGAKCILTDNKQTNNQITVIDDIGALKNNIYKDENQKKLFLQILNGRLSGNADERYPEEVIEIVLGSMNNSSDKQVMNKIIMTQKKEYYTIHEPDKLLEFINGELKPKEKEKKEHGEVFTPLSLVIEMLNNLDEAYITEYGKSIFSEPTFKWLDPAVGIGNFPIIVYQRLMEGLKQIITDDEERRKHILEQMLYAAELTPKNVFIYNKIFCGDTYKLNIYKGDTLKMNVNTEFKLPVDFKGFDVILGNPPYNPPKTATGSSGNAIWQNFVIKSVGLLNNKGYLCFVHPPGWKKPTDEIFKSNKFISGDYTKQIRQGQVWQVLKEHGVFSFIYTNDQKNNKMKEYFQYFPAVDYYVFQKDVSKKHVLCNTINVFLGEVISSTNVRLNYNLNYLPNLITNQTQYILHKVTSKEGSKPEFGIYRDKPSDFFIEPSKGKYRYIYTYNKKSEPQYKYSDNLSKDDNINMNKVIMNYDGGIDSFTVQYVNDTDKTGSFHMTMYYKVDSVKEGNLIAKFFNTDIVKFIFLITQYASGKMTKNEPLVANSITIPTEGITDYYKFFDIEDYKEYIEDILKKYELFKQPKKVKKVGKVVVEDQAKDVRLLTEPINLHAKIELMPLIGSPVAEVDVTKTTVLKKPKTLKNRTKLRIIETVPVEVVSSNKIGEPVPLQTYLDKIFNPVTKRFVKDTPANRKKIAKNNTLKTGGKPNNKTIKKKYYYKTSKSRTIKHKQHKYQ